MIPTARTNHSEHSTFLSFFLQLTHTVVAEYNASRARRGGGHLSSSEQHSTSISHLTTVNYDHSLELPTNFHPANPCILSCGCVYCVSPRWPILPRKSNPPACPDDRPSSTFLYPTYCAFNLTGGAACIMACLACKLKIEG